MTFQVTLKASWCCLRISGTGRRWGVAIRRMGYSFSVVSTLGKNDLVNSWLQRLRRYHGLQVIHEAGCAKSIVSKLKSGDNVGLFIDVPARSRSIPLSFMGDMVWRSSVINRLAHLTNAPCIFVFNQRNKTGMYQICAERVPPDVEPLQWCHSRLETLVESTPSQWVWLLDKPRR